MDDVDQMLEAQNERRRRSGRPELSEDDIRADVDAQQREQEQRAADFRRSKSRDEECMLTRWSIDSRICRGSWNSRQSRKRVSPWRMSRGVSGLGTESAIFHAVP